MYALMQSFGSLACLLYYRISKLSKDHQEDLRLIRQVRFKEARRWDEGGKYYELKFLILTLDFFNYHISLAKRDLVSKSKVDWLIRIFPSFRQMKYALSDFYVHEDV